MRREIKRLRLAADESEDAKAPRNSMILELMPHDVRCAVLEFAGGDDWMSALPMASRGLRDLCARKEMRDAVRRWAMGVFKRGMGLYCGYSGMVSDWGAGKALIRKAAKAGLRSARAWVHYTLYDEDGKAFFLFRAEVEGSASESEASGGPCVHAARMLAGCYEHGWGEWGVWKDKARALELYHHAVEVDENNQHAMYELARVYQEGFLGQAVDYERALSLHKRGAELGFFGCRRRLGVMYRDGLCGVEVDLKQALYWMEKANEQSGGGEADSILEMRRNAD